MEYLKRIILLLFISGIAFAATVKHAKSQNDEDIYPNEPYNDTYDDAYPGDDDYVYDDDVDEYEPLAPGKLPYPLDPIKDVIAFDEPELTKTAYVGQGIILPCRARNVRDNNVFMWYNKSQPITQQHVALSQKSRISVESDYSLKISELGEFDSGLYYCLILPEHISQNITLEVLQLAIILDGDIMTNKEVTVREGEKLVFNCRHPGSANIKYKWSKGGKRIEDNMDGFRVGNGEITIEKVTHHHHGSYQCLADGGQKTPPHGSLKVNVMHKPKINVKRHYVNAAVGDSAELYCNYLANPGSVTIFWTKDGTAIPNDQVKYSIKNNERMDLYNANHTVLIIDNMEVLDFGEYQCVVKNELGVGSGRIHLVREPEIPHFENITINGREAKLHWLVRSTQTLSEAILNYRADDETDNWIKEPISPPLHHDTGIWKLQHDVILEPGTYHARVKTKNTNGWSKFSRDFVFVIKDVPTDVDDTSLPSTFAPPDDVLAAGIGGNTNNAGSRQQSHLASAAYGFSSLLVFMTLVPYFQNFSIML